MDRDSWLPMRRDPAAVPLDFVVLGVLMIFSGGMDLYLIVAHPEYGIPTFGVKRTGTVGWALKLIAPPMHFVLGYGALSGRRWAYRFLMLYSLYGLFNAAVNRMLLPAPHRIRTVFLIGTLIFIGYLYIRRERFKN